ncbi:hypothetical protein Q4555_12660 [Octadecabacter sp. 1_MG-2023]|uniref:hypothetical protein n=1 Tax=unclassified Octadecabacter TaxID=196158 RepID=UPI001C0857E6|nr:MULTISPECIES: hypothetical protein [unclassified Octadecabacter]MBU2993632.1 hypothetical protein [Octadecabacter sp. B2R22]MDO6735524.1 hypothetical protein [Octadecabacter sp. 1_MG-2023]
MTKAKMPVAKHRTSRAEDARTGQVWTEELTLHKASAVALDPAGIDPFALSGRLSRVGIV